jgi:hypothetical protein
MNVPPQGATAARTRDTGRGQIASSGRIPRSAPTTGIADGVGTGDNDKEAR